MLRSLRHVPRAICRREASTLSCEEMERKYLVPTYNANGVRTMPGLEFEYGKGSTLVSNESVEYLDFGSGIAVAALGYGDAGLVETVSEQLSRLHHTSNLFHTRPPLQLAQRLVELSGLGKAFLCNSGTEANEAALKFARRFHARDKSAPVQSTYDCSGGSCGTKEGACACWTKEGQSDRVVVVGCTHSFHGRSMGSLSVTHKPKIRSPFAPLVPDARFLPYNDVAAIRGMVDAEVAAVIVEPVQGEGGVHVGEEKFLRALREACDEAGSLLIFDEVQCGLGRTGHLFAKDAFGVQPDMMTLAKPLAGGLPIGVTLVSDEIAASIRPGDHGTTFGGNPLVTAAASYVLDTIADPKFLEQVCEKGELLAKGLDDLATAFPEHITQSRCKGLFAGIELKERPASDVVAAAAKRNLIVLSAGEKGNVVRIAPPLIITKAEIKSALDTLRKVFKTDFKKKPTKPTEEDKE